MYIKLTNFQKRTAELFLLSLNCAKTAKLVIAAESGPVEPESQDIIGRVPGGWVNGKTPQQITEALIKAVPEIDMQLIGKPVRIRSVAYLDEQRKPAAHFRLVEEKVTAEGVVKEVKPPASAGSDSATLQVISDAPTSPDSVQLRGVRALVRVASNVNSFTFSIANQSVPADTVITLPNSGTVAVTIAEATITGRDSLKFASSLNCPR